MIVVDSSCLIAILQDEAEKNAFRVVLASNDRCLMSAVNVHEAACVMRGRYGAAGVGRLWDLIGETAIEIASFDEFQARAASAAFDRYGKGVHSKASLNLADCAAYALAKTMGAPLLFKGDDFAHTDIARA